MAGWIAAAVAFGILAACWLNALLGWGVLGPTAPYVALLSLLPAAAALRLVVEPALARAGARHLSFNRKRALLLPFAAAMALTGANVLAGWGLFGRLDRAAVTVTWVLAALVLHYIGPTIDEIRAYRDRLDAAKRQ